MSQNAPENVLIIEDDRDYCELVERALRLEGFDVRTAGTLREGMEAMAAKHPDVVVLDLGLPDSPIDETVEAVKKKSGSSTAIVVLSGNSQAAEHCIMQSASGFVDKNTSLKFLATELRNAIRTLAKIEKIDCARQGLLTCRI